MSRQSIPSSPAETFGVLFNETREINERLVKFFDLLSRSILPDSSILLSLELDMAILWLVHCDALFSYQMLLKGFDFENIEKCDRTD